MRKLISLTLACLIISFCHAQTDWIPIAGSVTTIAVEQGDSFFDPSDGMTGGPGGDCINPDQPGNYPNCNCTTTTTLCGSDTMVLFINKLGMYTPSDWIKIYDGNGTVHPLLFDNSFGGAQEGTGQLENYTIVGTSSCLTIQSFFNSSFARCGWDMSICIGSSCIPTGGNVLITDGTETEVDSSAVLAIQSSTKGVLLPTMPTDQRLLVEDPAQGLLIYDSFADKLFVNRNSGWTAFGHELWQPFGDDLNYIPGNVAIGRTVPLSNLHVWGNNINSNGQDGITMTVQNSSFSGMSGIRLLRGNDLNNAGAGLFHQNNKLYLSLNLSADTVDVNDARIIVGLDTVSTIPNGTNPVQHITSNGVIIDGAENNGSSAALQIGNGAEKLLLDENEIDALEDLSINGNNNGTLFMSGGGGETIWPSSAGNIGMGLSSIAGNAQLTIAGPQYDGDGNGTLRLNSGFNTMYLDGRTINAANGIRLQSSTFGYLSMVTGGGNVRVGSNTSYASKVAITGPENDGVSATLRLNTGPNHMLLDGNEIDAFESTLAMQSNSSQDMSLVTGGGDIRIGTNSLYTSKVAIAGPDNNGISAVLRLISGSHYMLVDGNEMDVFGGNMYINYNSSADTYIAQGGGHVGINDSSPSAMLHIKQAGGGEEGLAIENDSDNDVWAFEVGANNMNVYFNGIEKAQIDDADGSWDQQSDRRLKKDITYLNENILAGVLSLKPATYRYIDNETSAPKSMGFIAQEVGEVFPDLVGNQEGPYLSLNYADFAVLAIKAVQEQQDEIDQLKHQNKSLERRLLALEQIMKDRRE